MEFFKINILKFIFFFHISGSQDVAHDYDILMAHNITHIINCATGVKNIFLGKIKYLTLDVLDLPWTNLVQYFNECHEFMRKAIETGGNVCFLGIRNRFYYWRKKKGMHIMKNDKLTPFLLPSIYIYISLLE